METEKMLDMVYWPWYYVSRSQAFVSLVVIHHERDKALLRLIDVINELAREQKK